MRRLVAASAALALLGAGSIAAAGQEFTVETKSAALLTQDFVFFGESRPVLVRLHTEIDGRPLEAVWNDFLDRLFAHLDVDGDGVLDADEMERAPTPQALFAGGFGGFVPTAPQGPARDEFSHRRYSRERFGLYFRRNGGVPFQSQMGGGPQVVYAPNGRVVAVNNMPGAGPSADAINNAFFDLLDSDKDGKISREELAAAPEILMKLDADDDEVVTLNELLKIRQPVGPLFAPAPAVPVAAADDAAAFLVTAPALDPSALPRQLQRRYGPKDKTGMDKTLTRRDLGLDQRTFDLLDADKDGALDYEELLRFTERPADVELKVSLGKRGQGEPMIETMTDAKNPSPLASSVKAVDAGVRIEVGNARLDLGGVEVAPLAAQDFVRQQFLAEFKAADRDNNGYLDEQEAMQSRLFRNVFKAMDRDGDGKVVEKEVIAYLDAMKDLQSAASASCASAAFADDGLGLFDLVDLNHDGRLSLREMRQMVKLLDRLDADGDGKIGRSEIKKGYRITFRQGPINVPIFNIRLAGAPGVTQPAAPAAGPLWFRKMDRNHDGDVSRRDFLGSDEEFKRLDLDGDGLISLEEATKADANPRKP